MGSYKVEIKRSALKDIKKLEKGSIPPIYRKIASLSDNPHPAQSQKLKGMDNSYRLRIGDYRIIYQIDHQNKAVMVFGIGHRKDIYRD
ncbi:MAG: type II toxin-antitoxin system RelE/ParE family toxin [Candidatus Margulisiibacteriota bacterium]